MLMLGCCASPSARLPLQFSLPTELVGAPEGPPPPHQLLLQFPLLPTEQAAACSLFFHQNEHSSFHCLAFQMGE